MKKAIFTIGISASGKTTWAKDYAKVNNFAIICQDDARREIQQSKGIFTQEGVLWAKWNWKDEPKVTEIIDGKLNAASLLQYEGIIIADTNLNPKHLEEMKKKVASYGFGDIEEKYFDISYENALSRDAARLNGVGQHVIYKQWLRWNELVGKKPVISIDKKSAIIVDIDGTLAHMNGGRGPFEWDKVKQDSCDELVKAFINHMHLKHSIIVVSGRDAVSFSDTTQWLIENEVLLNRIYMRAAGDMRDDRVVKEEIFWKYIHPEFNVQLVIDDRPKVVRMWLDLGLKVWAVGNPYLEF